MAMFSKIKQFKDMRSQAKAVQKAMGDELFVGAADGDLIKVTVDGMGQMQGASIDASLLVADKKEEIEKGIVKASNKAMQNLAMAMMKKRDSGELQLPGAGA